MWEFDLDKVTVAIEKLHILAHLRVSKIIDGFAPVFDHII
jgi:hypothetical protein